MPPRQTRTFAVERRTGSGTATPSSTTGSTTVTETEAGPSIPLDLTQATLRLRAEPEERTPARRIQWAEDVVDNEGMGKKSSKVCCIYHKPREAGDASSDESSSSSSSDESDGEPDLSRAQPGRRRRQPHDHPHNEHSHDRDQHAASHAGDGPPSKGKGKARKPSPNAYEKVPKRKEQKT